MSDLPEMDSPEDVHLPAEHIEEDTSEAAISESGTLEAAAPAEVLSPEEKKLRDRQEVFRAFGLLSQVGLTMLICVVVGLLFGRMLDTILGSSPWLLVFGAFLGGGAAIKVMYDIGTKE